MRFSFAQAEEFARRVQIRRELIRMNRAEPCTDSLHPCTTMDDSGDKDDPGALRMPGVGDQPVGEAKSHE